MPVNPIPSFAPIPAIGAPKIGPTQPVANGPGFDSVIGDALQQVDQIQRQASEASIQVAGGQAAGLDGALLTVEEAGLALQLALQVRNRLVDSYQEIMRMPV